MIINVIDAIMGTGKTTGMINYMNEHTESQFVFITPYLSEVERVLEQCSDRGFKQPLELGSKMVGFKYLLSKGVNIATTHSLFLKLDDECVEEIRKHNYVLVIDESLDFVKPIQIDKKDLGYLSEDFFEKDENGYWKVKQGEDEYFGALKGKIAEIERYRVRQLGDGSLLMIFPIDYLKAFKKIFVMTFLFRHQVQRGYFDLFRCQYVYWRIVGDNPESFYIEEIGNKPMPVQNRNALNQMIRILDHEKLNDLGKRAGSLSYSWYKRATSEKLERARKDLTNFFINISPAKKEEKLWTTFKMRKEKLSRSGYSQNFIPANTKATNEYRDAISVAYMVNRYLNPMLVKFFKDENISISGKGYALTELLQFLWRSAIRDGKPITLYIPSKRMRTILQDWLNDNDDKIDIELFGEDDYVDTLLDEIKPLRKRESD